MCGYFFFIEITHAIKEPYQPRPEHQVVQSISTGNVLQIGQSPLPPTQWTPSPSGHMSPYLSSRNSWSCHRSGPGLLEKKKKPWASGSVRATQASAPNHPLPWQHSSRQQLQQINLPLTVHLDWINLELGAITAIGRHGYSPNAGCYPALGIKKRSQLSFFLLSFFPEDRLDKVFFRADHGAEGGSHWISWLTKSSLFSINSQTQSADCFFFFFLFLS